LFLTVLVGGTASVRNAAETFGLDYSNLLGALGKLLREHDSRTHVRYLYTTDLSLSGEEIEEACPGRRSRTSKGRQGPGTPRSGGLQGYLTIFTINNVVGELRA
jgi:hypothetical protein